MLHNCKCTNCDTCLGYISAKNNRLIFEWIKCSKKDKNHFNKDLIKGFENTYEIIINKFILLLRKGVYPYEHMDSWKRLDEE